MQDGVLEAGVLPLILESTKSDHSAPMAREWALMAIRNLCEGNLDAQVLDRGDCLRASPCLMDETRSSLMNVPGMPWCPSPTLLLPNAEGNRCHQGTADARLQDQASF